jgi:hypothetical protein
MFLSGVTRRSFAALRLGVKCLVWAALASQLIGAQDLAPPDGFLGVWRKEGAPRVFRGSDLYGHIDGGSELFLEFGFEELTVQRYRSGADQFSLELYRMSDPLAAAGIYLMKQGTPASEGRLPVPYTLGAYQLMFACDRYLVALNNLEGSEAKLSEMLEFGRHIISKLPAAPAPAPAEYLPMAGLVSGSFRLIRGSYALQSVFSLGPGNILSLARGQTAASGDYRQGDDTWTLIACHYPDPRTAGTAFEYVASHLDPYLKTLSRSDSSLVFQDYANEYGTVSIFGDRLEVRVHLKRRP